MKNQQTKLNESSTRRRGFTVSQKSQMGKIKFKEKNILKKKEKKIEKYLATNIAANIIALFRTVMTAFIRHHPPHSSSSFRMFFSFFFLLPFVFEIITNRSAPVMTKMPPVPNSACSSFSNPSGPLLFFYNPEVKSETNTKKFKSLTPTLDPSNLPIQEIERENEGFLRIAKISD